MNDAEDKARRHTEASRPTGPVISNVRAWLEARLVREVAYLTLREESSERGVSRTELDNALDDLGVTRERRAGFVYVRRAT